MSDLSLPCPLRLFSLKAQMFMFLSCIHISQIVHLDTFYLLEVKYFRADYSVRNKLVSFSHSSRGRIKPGKPAKGLQCAWSMLPAIFLSMSNSRAKNFRWHIWRPNIHLLLLLSLQCTGLEPSRDINLQSQSLGRLKHGHHDFEDHLS